ncbi:hypothetical protein PYCC9005_000678 [Savitreella phatthalungensis]
MESLAIARLEHLSSFPCAAAGLRLLEDVCRAVSPIIRSFNLHVHRLREFYPHQSNLLGTNLNRGQVISLRLRSPHHRSEFLAFDDIVSTLLHELAHNHVSPHDARFYSRLDDLSLAYALLPPRHAAPARPRPTLAWARAAAIAGARGTGPGGQVLGGRGGTTVTAGEAAARRRFDNTWCGKGTEEMPVEVEEEGEVIEIASDDDGVEVVGEKRGQKRVEVVPGRRKKAREDGDRQHAIDRARMKARGLLADTLGEHLAKLKAAREASRPRPGR